MKAIAAQTITGEWFEGCTQQSEEQISAVVDGLNRDGFRKAVIIVVRPEETLIFNPDHVVAVRILEYTEY